MKIGLDIFGGDQSPDLELKAAISFAESNAGVKVVLIGDEHHAKKILEREGITPSLFEFIHTTESISMHDHPVKAMIQKRNASIPLGLLSLREGKIDAFASLGNTGAMLVGSMQVVKSIPGVIRPCISSLIPQMDGSYSLLLDVGTNADCKSDVLYQFGIMGSVYAKEILKKEEPRVALLNIGEEEEKGNLLSKAAHSLMKDNGIFNFIGNVEGRDLFSASADVIVCDGFTGNIVLKQAEAFYGIVKARNVQDEFFDRFNYENYGGTPILGVNGAILIGHGKSSQLAIERMLKLALDVAQANLAEKMTSAFN